MGFVNTTERMRRVSSGFRFIFPSAIFITARKTLGSWQRGQEIECSSKYFWATSLHNVSRTLLGGGATTAVGWGETSAALALAALTLATGGRTVNPPSTFPAALLVTGGGSRVA